MSDLIGAHLRALGRQLADLTPAAIEPLAASIEVAWRADRTIFIAGNGGSAATASHFATDLAKTTSASAPDSRRIRALALTENAGLLTAWANDAAYERVFAEQLRNLARPDDLLIAISTSGESPNLIAAFAVAADYGVRTLALAPPASALANGADLVVPVECESVQVAEDLHHVVCHSVTVHMRSVLAAARDRPTGRRTDAVRSS